MFCSVEKKNSVGQEEKQSSPSCQSSGGADEVDLVACLNATEYNCILTKIRIYNNKQFQYYPKFLT